MTTKPPSKYNALSVFYFFTSTLVWGNYKPSDRSKIDLEFLVEISVLEHAQPNKVIFGKGLCVCLYVTSSKVYTIEPILTKSSPNM